jgi:chromate transporter
VASVTDHVQSSKLCCSPQFCHAIFLAMGNANRFVAQAAPGPNILIVSLIGWQVAGLGGLLAATVAINGPHCLLTYFVGGFIAKGRGWVGELKSALVPITTGLILGSGLVMARSADHDVTTSAVSAATATYVVLSNRNPLWALMAAALAGVARAYAWS